MQFVYFIVFGSRRRITFGITMCAFAVKTSTESPQTVADESATNECVADKDVADKDVAGASIMPARRFRRPTVRQVKFVYFIVFRAGRRITFGITMCAFAVKTSVKSPQTVADESATNDGVADKDVADEGVVPAYRFRRLTVRQVKFVYFIVFRAGRRITFEITMCAFAVKTSVKSNRTVADEGVVPACRFRRPRIRQVQFVYFIVFGAGRRITF